MALLLTAILTAVPAQAQQSGASSAETATSSPKDGEPLKLPVSLEKIRGALEQPASLLKGLDEKPHFRVEIRERQKFEDLVSSLKFDSGPVVPGGLYGYDQQQNIWPKAQYPEMQPYGAFSQGQLLQVALTTLIAKYFAGRALSALSSAERAAAERAAREEVAQAIAGYCAAQPNGGAGIQICATPLDLR